MTGQLNATTHTDTTSSSGAAPRRPLAAFLGALALVMAAIAAGAVGGVVACLAIPVAVPGTATAGAASPGWTAPAKVPGVSGLVAVSCPNAAFCMAVGKDDAVALVKGRWRAPVILGTDRTFEGGLSAVSCTGPSFCLAGSGDGATYAYDGSGWTPLGTLSTTGIADLSCASPSFCGALDLAGASYFYDGTSWSGTVAIRPASQAMWLSCPAVGTCVAVDAGANDVVRYSGGRWSAFGELATSTPAGGSEPNVPSAVSCAGPQFCAALDDFGEAFTRDGGRWSGPTTFDHDLLDGADAVSCVSASFCMVVDDTGQSATWNGSSWSSGAHIVRPAAGLTAVSCASTRFCVAVAARGQALRYR